MLCDLTSKMFAFRRYTIVQKSLICDLKLLVNVSRKYCYNVPALPDLDFKYLCSSNHAEEIYNNIIARKGIGNIKLIIDLKAKLDAIDVSDHNHSKIRTEFYNELLKIPNRTHPDVACLKEEPRVVSSTRTKKEFDFKPMEFYEITKRLNLIRTDQLGNVCGNRSYFILGEMAELEQALIKYSVNSLLKRKFRLISVPDILHRNIIEGCGLNTTGARTQVYTLEPKLYGPNLCLSGTSEMALAGHFINKTLSESELPIKLAAVSRCYRAEGSSVAEEKGIYRVHQFTKVEMFVVSSPEKSDELLEELRSIEEENFGLLGLHLRTLDMPPHELGAPAYRKYDVEAWLPGRNIYGEISSCSNCTDYQSRRLGIKYKTRDGLKYVHTLNGTVCAIPRMLIALTETFQTNRGLIEVPEVLQKYMRNKKHIGKQKKIPELRLVKHKK